MATSKPRLTVKQSLTPSELDDVGALVREARWNQLAADWRIFIEFGRLYAIHSEAGRIIATTATLPYGGRFAWISMVLVAGEYRRRGLATALLRRAMADLAAAKLVPVLDATPDGRAVYRRLGFEDSCVFQRLIRRDRQRAAASVAATAGVTVRPITDADWPPLCGRARRRARERFCRFPARPRRRFGRADRPADCRRRCDRRRARGARARRDRRSAVRRPC
jgi:GNAT superfamily N-acetyltransferase